MRDVVEFLNRFADAEDPSDKQATTTTRPTTQVTNWVAGQI